MIKFILTKGLGFSPGSVKWIPTHGFSSDDGGGGGGGGTVCPDGRDSISVTQGLGVGGEYPFICPSDNLDLLIADVYLNYADSNCDHGKHFKIDWLCGFGTDEAAISPAEGGCSTHPYDLQISDREGDVVFDSTEAIHFSAFSWGTKYKVLEWVNEDDEILRLVIFTCWDPDITPLSWPSYFEPADSKLDPRTYQAIPPQVRTISVVTDKDDPTKDILLPQGSGVIFQGGYNVEITPEEVDDTSGKRRTQPLTIHSAPGLGIGKFPCATDDYIRKINDTTADTKGNVILDAFGCYRFERPLFCPQSTINMNYDGGTVSPEAIVEINKAAAFWQSILRDPVTIGLDVSFANLGTGIVGTALSQFYKANFNEARQRMVDDAGAHEHIVTQLPTREQLDVSTGDAGIEITMTRANALALGYAQEDFPTQPTSAFGTGSLHGTLQFRNGLDLDPDQLYKVALHEIGHTLGFISAVGHSIPSLTTLDLFRLAPGEGFNNFTTAQRVMTTGVEQVFYDGGIYDPTGINIAGLTVGDIPLSSGQYFQPSHWKDDDLIGGRNLGIMDPSYEPIGQVSSNDKRALDLMGWDLICSADTELSLPFPSVAVIESTLKISNDCGPCCECQDFVNVYEGIRRLSDKYEELGERAEAVRDQYRFNRDRWLADKQCRKGTSLQLAMQELPRCRVAIAAALCNTTDGPIHNIELRLCFTYGPDGEGLQAATTLPGCILCNTTTRRGNNSPTGKPSAYRTHPYKLSGQWPRFSAYFDCINPGENGLVSFLMFFPGCTDGDRVEVVLCAYGEDTGGANCVSDSVPLNPYGEVLCCDDIDPTDHTGDTDDLCNVDLVDNS